jgi:hypothetical protein
MIVIMYYGASTHCKNVPMNIGPSDEIVMATNSAVNAVCRKPEKNGVLAFGP